MKGEGKRPKEHRISPNLVKKFSIKHYLSRDMLSGLDEVEIKELGQIASGKIPQISRGDRIKALTAIAHIGGAGECKMLGRIVADEKEDSDVRAVAAISLSLSQPDKAERELIANTTVKSDIVLGRVARSLGRIGGEASLKALDKISDTKSNLVRKEVAFAKALISYRLGIERDTLRFVMADERKIKVNKDTLKLDVRPASTKELRNCLDLLEGSSYRLNVSKDFGFKMGCGRTTFMLLMNKDSFGNGILSRVMEQKQFAGLVTLRSEETGTYAVQSLVLTSPHESSTLDIMVCRTDGTALYSGRGYVKDGAMTFSVSDLERPGSVPSQITGKLSAKGIEFEECYSLRTRQGKRSPMELKR